MTPSNRKIQIDPSLANPNDKRHQHPLSPILKETTEKKKRGQQKREEFILDSPFKKVMTE